MMDKNNLDLIAAADRVLQKLDSMSVEELLLALENCEDHSIDYALNYDSHELSNYKILEHYIIEKNANISENYLYELGNITIGETCDYTTLFTANDSEYALAA